jgi:ankyrin repeat protein
LQLALASLHPESLDHGVWCNHTLDVLLKNGANVNIVASETHLTPLNTALEGRCSPEVIQKLLSRGADASFGPKPAIASAIESSDQASLEMLLKAGSDPNLMYMSNEANRHEEEPQLETPLQTAACGQSRRGYDPWGDLKRSAIIKLLIQYGANVGQQLKDGTTTVLHEVAGVNGFVKPMLVDGVNLEQRDANGRTPLIRACEAPVIFERAVESEYAALELIEAGADVNAIDETGSRPLHYALRSGELPKTIKKLLDKGANPNITDGTGMPPLYYSFDSWCPQDTVDLLDAGADRCKELQMDEHRSTTSHQSSWSAALYHSVTSLGECHQVQRRLPNTPSSTRAASKQAATAKRAMTAATPLYSHS